MGLLGKGEAWLERSLDSVFGRVFGAKLSARAILSAVAEAVEPKLDPRGGEPLANRYRICLSPADHQRLAAHLPEVAAQARARVLETADAQGRPRPARVGIRIEPDQRVGDGNVLVESTYEPGPGAAELLSLDGRARLQFSGNTITIGRDEGSSLVIVDHEVSRKHARIEPRGDQYVLVDLNSANGTTVNSARVVEAALREGDVVSFGAVAFTFREC